VALLKRIQCLQNSRLQRTQADGYGRGKVALKKIARLPLLASRHATPLHKPHWGERIIFRSRPLIGC